MTPDAKLAALAARQHGALTRRQALDLGFTRSAILHRRRTGRWVDLQPGVYAISGTPATPQQHTMAIVLSYGPRAVAGSLSAAWLLGLLVKPPEVVYVVLPPGQHRRKRKRVVAIQAALSTTDVRTVYGIRIAGPERTIVDAAAVLSKAALETLLDDAVQTGLTTVTKLRRYIRDRNLGHRPGTKALRELLDDRTRGVPQKELEKLFLRKLRASGLPDPARQHPCGEFFIDIAYPAQRIAIELDGRSAHFSGCAFRADPRRRNQIVLAGWTLYLFTWEDVNDLWPDTEAVLRRAIDSA